MIKLSPQRTLVKINAGSHLYGTSTPESDIDFKSVHLPSGRDLLLQRAGHINNSTGTQARANTADDIDDMSLPLHRYLELVVGGDMLEIELLFAPEASILEISGAWDFILNSRESILNSHFEGFVAYCRNQVQRFTLKAGRIAAAQAAVALFERLEAKYGPKAKLKEGWAEIEAFTIDRPYVTLKNIPRPDGVAQNHLVVNDRAQAEFVTLETALTLWRKMVADYGKRARAAASNQGVDWKGVMHATRIAEQAIELLSDKHITLPRPNTDYLRAIKAGQFAYDPLIEKLEAMLNRVEVLSQKSALAAESDTDLIDTIVLSLYQKQVNHDGSLDHRS